VNFGHLLSRLFDERKTLPYASCRDVVCVHARSILDELYLFREASWECDEVFDHLGRTALVTLFDPRTDVFVRLESLPAKCTERVEERALESTYPNEFFTRQDVAVKHLRNVIERTLFYDGGVEPKHFHVLDLPVDVLCEPENSEDSITVSPRELVSQILAWLKQVV